MAFAIGIDSATHCLPSGSDFNPLTCRMSRQSEAIGNPSFFDSARKAFCRRLVFQLHLAAYAHLHAVEADLFR